MLRSIAQYIFLVEGAPVQYVKCLKNDVSGRERSSCFSCSSWTFPDFCVFIEQLNFFNLKLVNGDFGNVRRRRRPDECCS